MNHNNTITNNSSVSDKLSLDNNYMILYETKSKIPLLSKNGFWFFSVDGINYKLESAVERYLGYFMYADENDGEMAGWIRDFIAKNATPMQIDNIINKFEESHPVEYLDKINLSDIPLYADAESGLNIHIPFHCCVISKEHENELLNIIRNEKDYFYKILFWFKDFRMRYELDYSKKLGNKQDWYLTSSFLQQHGLNESLKRKREIEKKGNYFAFFCIVLFLTGILLMIYSLTASAFIMFYVSLFTCICAPLMAGALAFLITSLSSIIKKENEQT